MPRVPPHMEAYASTHIPGWVFAMAWIPPVAPDPCRLDVEDLSNPGRCLYCGGHIPHKED